MHKTGIGIDREERVKQSRGRDESVFEDEAYVPIGNAVKKLMKWQGRDAEITYLSPNESVEDVNKDRDVLEGHGFPRGEVHFRKEGESYGSVIERVMPDILVEDDCESIGGEAEVGYFQVNPQARERMKSIIVPEFGGIDHLPDNLKELFKYE